MAVREKKDLVIIGSQYMVRSQDADDQPLLSTGEFRGFAAIANETALVLKLDGSSDQEEGRIRFLPYHAILSIDVLRMASGPVQERKEDSQVYYR